MPVFGLVGRLTLAVVVVLAACSAVGAALLLRQTAAHLDALARMAEIEDGLAEEIWLTQRAVLEPRAARDLGARIAAIRERVAEAAAGLERAGRVVSALERLGGLDGTSDTVLRVRTAVRAQQGLGDAVIALALGGRPDAARALRGPEPDEVRRAVGLAARTYARALERAHRPVAIGSSVAAVLAAGAMAWLGWRMARLARAAGRLATEEQSLRASEERLRALVQHAADVIVVLEANGVVRHASPAVRSVLGYDPERLVGTYGWALVHPQDGPSAQAFAADLLERRGGAGSTEARWQHRDGTWRWFEVKGTNLLHRPDVRGIVLNARDITRHKSLEQQLVQRALHDQLTGLPNRMLFMDRLEQALERSTRRGRLVAVLFLDLDRFKLVNDSFGHDRGDQVLVEVAQRLRTCLRRVDTIARIGGDEFTVLLEDVTSAGDALLIAERIVEGLRAPFHLEGQEIFVGASIGIALGDSHQGATAEGLLRNADTAMYRAKANGRACFEVFKPSMRETVRGRLRTEAELRRAVERDELRLHYQPKVDLRSGRLVGFEALIRWAHPERGLVSPAEFISMAEDTGLILPIGRWVLETACRQGSRWRAATEDGRELVMAVNLSPRQFRHLRLVDDVRQVLARTGLDPGALELEITEGTAMGDADATVRTLERLKGLGVRLAIDDFGTGYSSLSYLRRFPIDVLKVDRSFVRGLPGDAGDVAIVRTVVGLTRALGLKAVAEGVETRAQLEELRALGCDLGQGYLFGQPVPCEAVEALLREPASSVPIPA